MSERGQFRGGSRGNNRGGRGGARGGNNNANNQRGGGADNDNNSRPKKENILDLNKYMDKEIMVKFSGGREGIVST